MSKGNSVQLSTFLSWKVDEDIGFNSVKKEGKELVVKVWCKSCAKYSDVIRSDSMAERSSEGRCVEVCGGIGLRDEARCHSTFVWTGKWSIQCRK